MFGRVSTSVLRTATRRSGARAYETGTHYPATMNELPIPQGSWDAANAAKQRFRNKFLLFGMIFFSGTITFARAVDVVEFGWVPWKDYRD